MTCFVTFDIYQRGSQIGIKHGMDELFQAYQLNILIRNRNTCSKFPMTSIIRSQVTFGSKNVCKKEYVISNHQKILSVHKLLPAEFRC